MSSLIFPGGAAGIEVRTVHNAGGAVAITEANDQFAELHHEAANGFTAAAAAWDDGGWVTGINTGAVPDILTMTGFTAVFLRDGTAANLLPGGVYTVNPGESYMMRVTENPVGSGFKFANVYPGPVPTVATDNTITTGTLATATNNRVANFGGNTLRMENATAVNILSTALSQVFLDANAELRGNNVLSIRSDNAIYEIGNGAAELPPNTVIVGQEVLLIDPATNRVYRRIFGIDDLADADTTIQPNFNGDRLVWDGTNWVNRFTNRAVGFTAASWSASVSGIRTISISQLTHLMPANRPITVDVQEAIGANWVPVQLHEIAINQTTGNVVLQILDGQEFTGRAIIRGF